MVRTYFHQVQHDDEENLIDPEVALPNNEKSNLAILDLLRKAVGTPVTST